MNLIALSVLPMPHFKPIKARSFALWGSPAVENLLVRHINRLIEPTSGDILIGDVDINALNPEQLRQIRAEKIGMVFQHTALLPHRTVQENVALGLELRNVDEQKRLRIAQEKLELVQLTGWEDRLPSELSGGMQQRVGLARAMAADPEILLMDELQCPGSPYPAAIAGSVPGTFQINEQNHPVYYSRSG